MKIALCRLAILLFATCSSPLFSQSSGSDLYKAKCQLCHGSDGAGDTPAGRVAKIVSFKDPSAVNAADADLTTIIKNGKNKMPAFAGKLSDDEIRSVVEFIRKLHK